MDDDRGEQQPLTQARLPRHQQRTAPPLHRVNRPQAEGEVAQMSGDKEKQNEATSQADAPYNQPREQHLRQRPLAETCAPPRLKPLRRPAPSGSSPNQPDEGSV